jgi:peptidoglycan-associated lipoprotein
MQQYLFKVLIIIMSIMLANCASNGLNTAVVEPAAEDNNSSPIEESTAQDSQSYPYSQAPTGYVYNNKLEQDSNAADIIDGNSAESGKVLGNAVSPDRIVYFDYDSATIRAESRPVIEANAQALNNNRRGITQLEGHTDERGSREYNVALGERRANAVRQYMLGLGVSPQQIRVVSYGEEQPAASGHNEQHYALNRRVEIVY